MKIFHAILLVATGTAPAADLPRSPSPADEHHPHFTITVPQD